MHCCVSTPAMFRRMHQNCALLLSSCYVAFPSTITMILPHFRACCRNFNIFTVMTLVAREWGSNLQKPTTIAIFGLIKTKANVICAQHFAKYYIVKVWKDVALFVSCDTKKVDYEFNLKMIALPSCCVIVVKKFFYTLWKLNVNFQIVIHFYRLLDYQ